MYIGIVFKFCQTHGPFSKVGGDMSSTSSLKPGPFCSTANVDLDPATNWNLKKFKISGRARSLQAFAEQSRNHYGLRYENAYP